MACDPQRGVRDITGIPDNHDLGVGTHGKLCQFSEHGLAAFVLSCFFYSDIIFYLISLDY